MRIRIMLHPSGEYWIVQRKDWFFGWCCVEAFCGDDSKQRAVNYGNLILHPEIIELK